MAAGVQQRDGAVVEGVVVGQRDAVHAEVAQHFDGDGWRAEEEGFEWVGPSFAAVGDRAFEIQEEEVGFAGDGHHVLGEEGGGRDAREPLGDLAAEHGVAGERELHGSADQL